MTHEPGNGMEIRCALGLLALVTALVWASVDAVTSAAAAENAPPPAAPGATAPERLAGTVRAVDARTHTVVVLTGVGHALRVLRVVVPAGLEIGGSADSTLSRLVPGCVVRIECRRTAAGRVASAVTLVRPASREAKP